ncbi:hypothetical protein [Thiomicrorhabdus aquaedulcis]|uniref:hypothetical protein n=1 Tax=Thiomicrorhabdus aquaedulcis TaxID=2211106 RepID=UPI000FDA4B5A|nr:hypothetical protein [Thiomicrorhabdus aquaedulcis]
MLVEPVPESFHGSTTLGEICDISAGLSLGKVESVPFQPNTSQDSIQLIRPQDLAHSNSLEAKQLESLDTIVLTDEISDRLQAHHFVMVGDIIISARGTLYHAALVKSLPDEANIILLNNMICLRPRIRLPEVILLYLNSAWFKEHVIEKDFPKMLSLTVKWLRAQKFILPTLEKRQMMVDLIAHQQSHKSALEKMMKASQDLVEGVLFEAMREASPQEEDN